MSRCLSHRPHSADQRENNYPWEQLKPIVCFDCDRIVSAERSDRASEMEQNGGSGVSVLKTSRDRFVEDKNPSTCGAKLIEWALQASTVNKSINLGTTNAQGIDMALKMGSHDINSAMHYLTSLNIMAEL